jgi:putative tryptophan/tyrosine transport system substrate-binding protein
MRRLTVVSLIAFTMLAWPMGLDAQQPPHRVIGFLTTASPSSSGSEQMVAFRRGLRDTGYNEGQNITIEYR